MNLFVYNAKGGTGKTAVALNLALTLKFGLVTNDRLSIAEHILPEEQYMILEHGADFPKIPDDWNIIFDFGGFPDARAIEAMKISEYVLIPILPHKENIQASLNFIQEIATYTTPAKIIVIVNQTIGNQFSAIQEAIHSFFPDIKIFNIKKSSVFAWMVEHKKSISELASTFKQHARHFQPVSNQFNEILEYIKPQ